MIATILHDILQLKHPKTSDVRRLGKSYKKTFQKWDLEDLFKVLEPLLEKGDFIHTTMAYQILHDQSYRFEEQHFKYLNKFVTHYIHDWWDCDDFCTHALASYFIEYPSALPNIKEWTSHNRFAVRRCAAVALIVLARKHLIPFSMIEEICTILYNDNHYLVVKGYGWLLKESTLHYHDEVVDYVTSHVDTMPRTSFRYAIEKLDEAERQYLMSL